MRKMICAFGCVIALLLVGCQTQLNPSNAETNSNQTIEDSTPNSGSTSEGDPVNTDADTDQADENDGAGTNTPSTPTLPEEIHGDADWTEFDPSDDATIRVWVEERELKNEGSLRGEIEVTHKLSLGKMELSEGETVLFHIETKSAGTELKITLTGAETGTVLEGSVTGSGDISFEIDTADEYTVVLENCSLRGVPFNIDYSIGGS